MLTELKEALSMLWTRIRRVEGWLYGISQFPMIIEEGTSYQSPVTWTYRKWSDGRAECWGVVPANTYNCTTASGYAYYVAATFNLPSNLFTSVEVGFGDRLQGTGSSPANTLITINTRELTTTSISIWVQSANSQSTQSLAISLYVRGNWKTPTNVTSSVINGNYYKDDVWNYNYLINKPSINGQIISGDKTLADYGFTGEIANDKVGYTTTVPTGPNTDGLKFVVLDTEPATKYDGWIYIITE